MKTDITFFSFSNSQPTDGGMARNHAFFVEMKKREATIYNHTSVQLSYRIFTIVRNILLLIFARNRKVLILQTVLLKFIFPLALFRFPAYRSFVQLVLDHVNKNNTLFIEINDLIYEQAGDLGIDVSPTAETYQKFIFGQHKLRFIFASQLMGAYAVEKYGVKPENIQTVINGAPNLNSEAVHNGYTADSEKITYIYAGTLNRGREIEKLIGIFAKSITTDLILIGIEGEWIKEFNYVNIHYLGKFDEETALSIASKCDIGIIPYDESKLYYNICYPTKNSFYIAAGLPILCTPLKETMRVFNGYPGTAFFESFDKWGDFLRETGREEVINAKVAVQNVRDQFMWDFLFKELRLDISKSS